MFCHSKIKKGANRVLQRGAVREWRQGMSTLQRYCRVLDNRQRWKTGNVLHLHSAIPCEPEQRSCHADHKGARSGADIRCIFDNLVSVSQANSGPSVRKVPVTVGKDDSEFTRAIFWRSGNLQDDTCCQTRPPTRGLV